MSLEQSGASPRARKAREQGRVGGSQGADQDWEETCLDDLETPSSSKKPTQRGFYSRETVYKAVGGPSIGATVAQYDKHHESHQPLLSPTTMEQGGEGGPAMRKRPPRRSMSDPQILAHHAAQTPPPVLLDDGTRSIVVGFSVLGLYLLVGTIVFVYKQDEFSGVQTNRIIDALYFSTTVMTTTGYGDIVPLTDSAKLFVCGYVWVGFGYVSVVLGLLVKGMLEHQEGAFLASLSHSMHRAHGSSSARLLLDSHKGRLRIRFKVLLAVLVVACCLMVGTFVLNHLEEMALVDAFYAACVSVTTVGFGDRSFSTVQGRAFAIVWLMTSTLAVGHAFVFFAESWLHHKNHHLAKLIIHRGITARELTAADADHDGYISEAEFILFKLKELEKVDPNDLVELQDEFRLLDVSHDGRLSYGDLEASHMGS